MKFRTFYASVLALVLAISLIPLRPASAITFNLSAKAECGYIMLQWDKVPNAVRYFVYRGPAQGQQHIMPLTDFPIIDNFYKDKNGLVLDKIYYYIVKAVDKNNTEFSSSIEARANYTCSTDIPTPPEINDSDRMMDLKYQVNSYYYWRNGIRIGPMDAYPEIRYSRVNLMARYLAEEIGATVGWDNASQTVTIKTLDGTTIEMQIGKSLAKINGVSTPLDPNNPLVVPYIFNSRTYTPLRFISYHLGANGPTDIVWIAEENTAKLTFKDLNCNWMDGTIRKVSAISSQYSFYKDCATTNPINSTIDLNMKDSILNLSFQQYFQKYNTQTYWCAQIRVDKDGNIIQWRARPDQYPNCCEQTSTRKARIIGYVYGSNENSGTTITVRDNNGVELWKGQTNAAGYYETSAIENCILPCPGTYQVTALKSGCSFFEATQTITFNQNQCCGDYAYLRVDFKSKCPDTETARIIGYVYGAGGNPGTLIQVRDEGGTVVWQGLTDMNGYYETSPRYNGILPCPGTYHIVASKAGYSFAIASKTTTFASGETSEDGWFKRVDFRTSSPAAKTGRILGHVYGTDVNPGIIVRIHDSNNALVWSGETNSSGYFETSADGEEGILISPGTYKVTPSKLGCSFTNASESVVFGVNDNTQNGGYKRVDFRSNCSPIQKGRIMGYVYGSDSNPGTTISVFDSSNVLVWRGQTNSNGYYETSVSGSICILTCPGTYKVVPSKAGCSFSNSNEMVTFSELDCCESGEYKRVDFRSNCSLPSTARIIGNITGSGGNPGTIVKVYDSSGIQVWSGQTDAAGYYETTTNGSSGILVCPGTYMIIPSKAGCTFSIPTQTVTFSATDSCEAGKYKRADFTSNCTPNKTARIAGRVYGTESNPGTLITITNSSGTKVWSGLTNSNGYYETSVLGGSCILKCPETYTIVPTKNGCTFTNPSETVTFSNSDCCEDGYSMRVNFTSNCGPTQTGRIIGYIFGSEANPGTSISIKDTNGKIIWSGLTDSNGYYETSDYGVKGVLLCPGTYVVTPSKNGCSYTDQSKTISFTTSDSCEDGEYKRVDFQSNCSLPKTARIIGYITGTSGNPIATVRIYDSNGIQVWTGQTNSSGYYETSAQENNGILKCPGTYKVVPSRTGCVFTNTQEMVTFLDADSNENGQHKRVDFMTDCSSIKTGRIAGNVYGSGSNPGVTITITNSSGAQVWKGQTNANGYYETSSIYGDCILSCPGTYKVVPSKAGFTFSHESETVTFPDGSCCEDGYYMRVDFNAYTSSTSEKARIIGYVSGQGCNPGTTISVYDMNNVKVWSGQTNSAGYYETSTAGNCILLCPGTYRIVPSKTGYIFSYASETVTFYDGDSCSENEYMRVDFRGYYQTYQSVKSIYESKPESYYQVHKEFYLTDDTKYTISKYIRNVIQRS